MKVIEAPRLQFRCDCGALNEGDPDEFRPLHTMPPSFMAKCAFCKCESRVFPRALVAKAAGEFIESHKVPLWWREILGR